MSLMHYLLEANLYLVAFYLLYVLLLRNTTLYQLNRAYLMVTTTIAFIIPLLQLGILKPQITTTPMAFIDADMGTGTIAPVVLEAPKWTIADYGLAIYAVVAVTMLALLVFKIVKLIVLSKKGITKQAYGLKLIEIPGQNVAFSFFGYLFVNSELLSSPTILHHEEIHIRQKHSWDVIYFEIVRIINWFNPVVYLLQKSIKEVHEFIADHEVARTEKGAADYADFLISNAYGLTPIQLTNSFFNKNLLKRRIIMLYQKPSGRAARLKYLLTLPLAGGLLCLSTMAFTNKDYGWIDIDPVKNVSPENITSPTATPNIATTNLSQPNNGLAQPAAVSAVNAAPGDTIYKKVDVQPTFPGGFMAFAEFLRNNIKYPAVDKEAKIQGRVFVQFVVEKDGSLSGLKAVRTPSETLSAEAIRVMAASPKWTPGMSGGTAVRVMFTVPVNFSLDNNTTLAPPPAAGLVQQVRVEGGGNGPVTDSKGVPVFNAVEVQPIFPGGEKAFSQFLMKNIRYPALAKENNVMGRVFVKFVVEKDGSLSDMKILRDPGMGLGDEAVRVLKLSPTWTPGMQKGEPVRVLYTVPINFSLDTNKIKQPNQITLNPPQSHLKDIVFNSVEINPTFPGGEAAFAKFLAGNIRYPKEAKDANVTGRVFLTFIVENDGSLSDITIVRDPGKGLGEEGLRVLKLSPKWKPGVQNGRPVRVKYTVPINFSLTK